MRNPQGFTALVLGDVVALDENAADRAVRIDHRLVDEVDEPLLVLGAVSMQPDGDRTSDVKFARRRDFVEQLDETLIRDLGQRFGNGPSDDLAAPDQIEISPVRHHEPVVRTFKERCKSRGHVEHLLQTFTLAPQLLFSAHLGARLDYDRDHAGWSAAFVHDARIIEVHPDRFGTAVTIERELLILKGQSSRQDVTPSPSRSGSSPPLRASRRARPCRGSADAFRPRNARRRRCRS